MENTNPRLGRKPIFTTETVLALLRFRQFGAPEPMTSDRFVQRALEEGVLPKRVHGATVLRVINGRSFPHLRDPDTGRVFDYAQVPRFARGCPPLVQRAVDPATGAPIKRLSKGREQLKNELRRELLAEARENAKLDMHRFHAPLQDSIFAQFTELLMQLELIKARLTKLEAAK